MRFPRRMEGKRHLLPSLLFPRWRKEAGGEVKDDVMPEKDMFEILVSEQWKCSHHFCS